MPWEARIDWEEALDLHRKGWTFAQIARHYGYVYKTVWTKLHAMGARPPRPSRRRRTKRGALLATVWHYTRRKCSLPTDTAYRLYGAKGVRMCREWADSFDAFHDWAVANGYRPGLVLARKDRSRGFAPKNCFWLTRAEKNRRRRHVPRPRRTITAFGETRGAADWSRDARCNVSVQTLCNRIRGGLEPEAAITLPPGAARYPARPRRRHARRAAPHSAPLDWEHAKQLFLGEGLTLREVARRVGRHESTVRKAFQRHGVRRHKPAPTTTPEGRRLHKLWWSLHRRCTDPADPMYPYNGAKGARVAREWSDFGSFFRWAQESGARPGLWLCRRDRRKAYSPRNCVWRSRAAASSVKEPPSHPTPARKPIAAFGQRKGILAWSLDPRCSVSATAIRQRLDRGWPVERAIAAPPQNRGSSDLHRRPITAWGTKKGLMDWTRDRRCKVTATGIHDRLRRGWSPEDAIATPPFRRPRTLSPPRDGGPPGSPPVRGTRSRARAAARRAGSAGKGRGPRRT